MNTPVDTPAELLRLQRGETVNLSRRRFLAGTAVGALVLGFGLPMGSARVQAAAAAAATAERGTQVPAFLEIRPDGTVRLLSPFMEGGQGPFTAMAQIVGEELDVDPAHFVVDSAPPGEAYVVMENGMRITGGSMSVRMSYPTMRRLGALARGMLLQAGAEHLGVPVDELSTTPGNVVHTTTGRSVPYGELAGRAMDLPVPDPASVKLRDPSQFRWIGKPVRRLDAYDKSTGKAQYCIDIKVDGMLHAAVQHAPRLGMTVGSLRNEDQIDQGHERRTFCASAARRRGCGRRALVARQACSGGDSGGLERTGCRQQSATDAGRFFQRRLARTPRDGARAVP